ncbi:MAG: two-component system, sporulation sensor kinase [Gaiellaceae bacterium]|nr:two-component system, sporulation sensor kinase [Gaiellaceae bacterium]
MRPSITLSADLARQHELIDAAIAVNEAPTLDEAFQVLADAGIALLGADRLVVIVWTPDLESGVIRAGAGLPAGSIGVEVPADEEAIGALRTGEPYIGPPILEGLPSEVLQSFEHIATVVRVPFVADSVRATFHASWHRLLEGSEPDEAAETLRTLTRLTTLAERSLREREQEDFGSVLDGVADGVVLSSPSGVVLNGAAQRILGISDPSTFSIADHNPRTLDGMPYELTPGIPGHETIEKGEGERFRIRAVSLEGRELVLDGTVSPVGGTGAAIVFRDVTDEHRENVLNRQTLEAVFDAMPTAISVADPTTHRLLTVNRAFSELVGRPVDEILGVAPPFPWWEPGEDGASGFVAGNRLERVYRLPDGRPQPVQISVHAVPGDDGEPALLLALIEDTTEERRMQQQLVQSGKLAAIGELAAGVAHEINNPLFAILGLTEFLLKEAEPGSKALQRLELIQQTGLEIKEIVRALLDFARENAEDRHVVPLEDVVQATVDLVRRTNAHKGVELVDAYDASGAPVSASPNQLKQIFLNLIANARQAMPNGGTVKVDVRQDGNWVIASVTDDGPGIEPAILERIFEPFFTTKRLTGGTGLGLSVSLGIAEAHGGSLTASSEPGRGSTFTLRLPISEEEVAT